MANSPTMYTLSPLERVRYLTTVSLLRDLPMREIALIAENAVERSFRRGHELLPAGRPTSGVHVIVEGRVRVPSAEAGDTMVTPGESIGLLSLLARSESGHEAIADIDTRTLEIGRDLWMDLLEDRFPLVLALVQRIAQQTLRIRREIEDGVELAGARAFDVRLAGSTDLADRLVWLRKRRIFRRASVESLIRLASTMEDVRLPSNQVLWKSGEKSGYSFFVLEGRVRCTLPEGRHFFAVDGYPLGNVESQAGSPRWYDAVTEGDTVMVRNDIESMHDILEDDFDLSVEFLSAQADGLLSLLRSRGEPIPF